METIKPLTRPKSIKVQAYDELKAQVLSRSLPPGQVLTEASLSQSLGISRTPVRQALARLISEGLVVEEGSRLQVRKIGRREAHDISELRLAIEGHTVRLLSRQGLSPEERETLDRATDAMAQLLDEDGTCSDIAEYFELNRSFHMDLANFTGNRLIVEATDRVLDLVVFSGLNAVRHPGRTLEVIREHRALVCAIADHEEERAYQLTAEHAASHVDSFEDDPLEHSDGKATEPLS
jgi:DNA-binding GntR family transcriptional regulator